MADHYSVLGLPRNASKEEIKEAFHKLAIQFHPDKHAQSPDSVRDAATSKFKQISEAYDVLIDDRKRDAYNFSNGGTSHLRRGGYSKYYDYGGGSYYKASSPASRSFSQADRRASNFDALLQFIATRTSIRNLAFATNHSKKQWTVLRGRKQVRMNNKHSVIFELN